MTTFTKIHQINRLSNIAKIGIKSTPKEIAGKLNMSESSLYNLIKLCKDFGMEIKYNRNAGRYESVNNNYIKIDIYKL